MDIELFEVRPARPRPDAWAAAPEDATRTDSGLAYVVAEPGTGTVHPTLDSHVEVMYTGWSGTTGEVFAGTHTSGRPWRQRVRNMISGFQELMPLLVEGERVTVWVPSELAYGEDAGEGRPAGPLVFDLTVTRVDP